MFRSILFSCILFASISFSYGQKLYFENYSVNQGLAQSKVHDVIQDKNGFIWLGTGSGASLFDGNNFINYSADNGLAESGIRTVYEDKNGNIWFGHSGGAISFYNGKIFQQLKLDSTKINGDITCFLEDSKDRFWIATQGSGAILINNFNNFSNTNVDFSQFTGSNNLSDRVFSITETSDSTIYFIIDNMIKYFDETEGGFKTYRHKGLSFYFQPTVMFEDKDRNLWYGTYKGGLYRQDYKTGNVTVFDQKRDGLAGQWVSCINQDKEGAIWVGTWGDGITRINPNFTTFNHTNGLQDNKIWKIINDREGNILIGTNENGLCIFKGEHIISFQPEHGLLSEQVTAVSEDNQNNIWIGTPKGLCKYNMSSKRIKPIVLTKNNITHEVISIKKSKTGKVWIATKEDGIYSYDPLSNKIDYNARFNSMIVRYGRVATSLEVDNDGHVYVGTLDGLYYLEPEKNATARILGGSEISCLYFDSKNTMWVGTRGKGIKTINDTVFNSIESLSKINSLCFTEDKTGNMWIGTEGQGLSVFTTDSMLIKYKTSNGLLADLISALSTDNDGNIWIGTNKGLNKFDINDETFYSYTEKSGFTGIEVKNQAMFTDFTGNIYCGTVNGLFKFNPRLEKVNNLEPLTQITNFKVNLKNRALIPNQKLSYKEKNIYFEYHGICLSNSDKVRYQVMLEGADIDWLPISSQTSKNYSPLPPGKYTFKVKACNNRGIWNSEPIEYPFIVKPPFYLTWWFILIIVLLIVFAIISYINIREKALKKEKIILEQKVKERTAEVVKKNNELAKKNQDIMDSIKYAKRIQQAILPSDLLIKKHFPESFVLFKPKDVVSGDFYWLEALDDLVIFSAVDCTGHGVPGAFMSIMGHDGLQRAVSEFQLRKPDEILEKLNNFVQDTLQRDNNKEVKDGMDMALCVYHPKNNILEYSGANNPIYIIRAADKEPLVRNGEVMQPTMTNFDYTLYETKPNKQPIGPYIHRVPFVMHTFQLQPGDSIYIFSDGYPDQFGGPKGRKFMYKKFKETILKNQVEDMSKQKSFYNQIINAWMSNCEQIDDICLMGVRV